MRSGDTRGEAYRNHVQDKTVAVSFVTVGELHYWSLRRKWSPKRIAELEARFRNVVIIPFDIDVCKAYAAIKNEAKTDSGSDRVIPSNDLWIAACARRHGIPVVSNNRKHFQDVPGITLISEAPTPPAPPSQPRLFKDISAPPDPSPSQ
jgi:tRNA(fMet)-specific endonuclease VapC